MAIGLNTVGIVVNDMGKSLNFYWTLGLNIPQEADGESDSIVNCQAGL